MEKDCVGVVEFPYYNSVKVHRSICLQLMKIVDRISHIFPAIETVRPRSTNGIPALCLLQVSVDKAKSLIQHCSESSKIYLAITGEKILSRCESICNNLESCLGQIQNMVPLQLAVKISGIIQDLMSTNFRLDCDDREAAKIVMSLMHKDVKVNISGNDKVLETLQLAASKLKITSPVAVLLEKRCVRKMLGKIDDSSPTKKKLLKYLFYLLKKYGDRIWQCKSDNTETLRPFTDDRDSPEPPEEFKCPISTRLMYDPSIIASGLTFERVWIERWFDEGNTACPVSHLKLEHFSVTPNSAMKSLIGKWCSKHEIAIPNPCLKSFLTLRSRGSCTASVASFGSDMDDLSLGVGNFSINSSNISGFSDLSGDDDSRGKTSSLLHSLADLSWESQCKVVEDAKFKFASNEQAQILSTSFYVDTLIKFMNEASRFGDVKAQRDGLEVLLCMLSHNRNETPCFQGDAVYLLASYLDSEFTGTALAILEILSYEQQCMSAMLSSGALPSILKILEARSSEFHTLAMKILANLSINSDIGHHMLYLGYIPVLVRFLSDRDLARFSIEIVKNLCRTEEARIAICENPNSVVAIGKLLESADEQEHALEILLFLCHSGSDFCDLVMTETVVESLVLVSVNGGSRARSVAMELLQLFSHIGTGNASRQCNDAPCDSKARKSSSTTLRLLGRVSRFAKSR